MSQRQKLGKLEQDAAPHTDGETEANFWCVHPPLHSDCAFERLFIVLFFFFPSLSPDDGEPGARPSAGAGGAPGGRQEARRRQGGSAGGGGRDAGPAVGLPAAPHPAGPAQGQAEGRQGLPPVLQRPRRRAGERTAERNYGVQTPVVPLLNN